MSEEIFSAWFSARLFEKRMTAGEFAQLARISRAAAYFYLDGSRVPSEMALAKIAVALGIDRSSMPSFARRNSKVEIPSQQMPEIVALPYEGLTRPLTRKEIDAKLAVQREIDAKLAVQWAQLIQERG